MHRATICAAAAVVAVAGLLSLPRCVAVLTFEMDDPGKVQLEPTAAEILYGVSADDDRWYEILNQKVKLPEGTVKKPAAAALLTELGVNGKEPMRVQPIVRYLVTHPGATGEQFRFGLTVLGSGLACQLVRNLMLHAYFAYAYSVRVTATVPHIRQTLSTIQQAVAGYLSRLTFFGYHQAAKYMVDAVLGMNTLFAECDQKGDAMEKKKLSEYIMSVCTKGHTLLEQQCVDLKEHEIVPTVRVTNYNHKIFSERTAVSDTQLITMIEEIDDYEFVEFGTMDVDDWFKWLEIVPFVVDKPKTVLTEGLEESVTT